MGASLQETMDLVKKAQLQASDEIAKTINLATGLVAYDLQAPAKNLYPVFTPIRNKVPRVGGGTGTATNWRQVSAILGSGYDSMAWVPEGQRAGRMSYTTANKAATYVTIGEEDQITYEARSAARNFEDLQATMVIRLLQKAMLKEELAILCGNNSLALGTAATPTLSAGGTGATLPTATYSVIVVAVTLEGYQAWKAAGSSLTTGLVQTKNITGADGQSFTLNGGMGQKSAAATQAITVGQVLSCSVTAQAGVAAYFWYVATAGVEKLEKVTTINSVTFSAPLAGTGQLASALTAADYSTNSLAFDGLVPSAAKGGSGAQVTLLATGTPGTGTTLTASGRGSVTEIDDMLRSMWDNYQLSPTTLFVNSQELKNITNKVLSNASAPLLQFFTSPERGASVIAAGGGVEFYFNPFAPGEGGVKIPIFIHPNVPPGTIIAWCETLPAQYQSSQVPNVVEVKTRQDYYQINWPLRTRAQEVGVYAEEVLAVYAAFGVGLIQNIANG